MVGVAPQKDLGRCKKLEIGHAYKCIFANSILLASMIHFERLQGPLDHPLHYTKGLS